MSPPPSSASGPKLDGATRDLVREIFESRIPFNRHLGLRVERLDAGAVRASLRARPEHVGNFLLGSLHGGVISATLDTVGGLAALLASLRALQRHGVTVDEETLRKRLASLATVDLRVDYLRPATGSFFLADADVLRAGRRVVVVRTELREPGDGGTPADREAAGRGATPADREAAGDGEAAADGRVVAYGTGSYIVV